MKKLNRFLRLYAIFICLAAGSISLTCRAQSDTAAYPPQIDLNSISGFRPFVNGSLIETYIWVEDLPPETFQVDFNLIDDHNLPIGEGSSTTGPNLTRADWRPFYWRPELPLSTRFQLVVHWSNDSVAVWTVPFNNLPDTLRIDATLGLGPFISSQYPLNDSLEWISPWQENTITLRNLPPRTTRVIYKFLGADSAVIDSVKIDATPFHYLDSAQLFNKHMEHLPLSVRYMQPVAYCEGGPPQGVDIVRRFTMVPQKPKLFCSNHGITWTDSVPVIQHKQDNGQVLLVDSVKHGMATNRPYGGSNTIGRCSFDVTTDDFTLEAWIHPDVHMIRSASVDSMTFMRADSAWWVSLNKNGDSLFLELYVVLTQYDFTKHYTCKLFTAAVDTTRFLDGHWHHIAFVRNQPDPHNATFFLDGEVIGTQVNMTEYNKLWDPMHSTYNVQIRDNPVVFGGCNALKDRNSFDRSFINKIDEIRIWGRSLSPGEIRLTLHKPVRQEYALYGYWNFNDLNNRLNFFDDISFYNNCGTLYEGALLEAGDPMGSALDSLFLVSSNRLTDSIRFAFHNAENQVIDSITISSADSASKGEARWVYDLASLPETVNLLKVHEYYPEERDTGYISDYPVRITPADPLTTTRNGWGMYYHSSPEGAGSLPSGEGHLYNAVTVTGLPDNTWEVQLGLKSGGEESNLITCTKSSNPYNHSLTLNGTSNYIESQLKTTAPQQFTLMLWFKTSGSGGGALAMFSNNLTGGSQTRMNHLLAVKQDGSLLFNILRPDSMVTLHATSQYNDGAWHHVAVIVPPYGVGKARMFVDGTKVDEKQVDGTFNFEGYWLFGRCFDTIPALQKDTVNGYFQGSLAEIGLWNTQLDYHRINRVMYLPSLDTCTGLVTYYPLDEGSGALVHDRKGTNNGFLQGSATQWFNDRNLSYVIWNADMSALEADMYTFFVRVFFPGAPDTGMVFSLGRFWVEDPVPGYQFSYHISNGLGYFNMGDSLVNTIEVWSDFQKPNTDHYYFRYFFLSPDSVILKTETFGYQNPPLNYSFDINTGLAPEGSYLEMIIFYDSMAVNKIAEWMYLPVLIRPMVPPKVYGNFGPFLQAIAPGTMKDENTYIIKTPVVDEMNAVKARFYDINGMDIGFTDATRINKETWSVTYDMASLSPPFTAMKLEFYLGGESFPAAVYGPYDIAITRTRPLWFDFIDDSDFSAIEETSTTVTFGITTTIEDQSSFDNSVHIKVPEEVPIFGGLGCQLYAPEIETRLEFDKKQLKLSVPEGLNPDFKEHIKHLGIGKETALSFSFANQGSNEYELDSANNLFTTQNRSLSGSMSGRLKKIDEIAKAIKKIMTLANAANPESIIVSPEFSLTTTESFKYTSRLHLMMDTVEHRNAWGSYGDLKVSAKEGTPENERSASYHFYAGTLGLSFEIGVNFLEGVASGVFCTDLSLNLGYGHSYITVPVTKTKPMKDFHIDISGKFVIKELWGVFEQVLWGPDLFYSKCFWGDDLSDLFPGGDKTDKRSPIPSGSSDPDLANGIDPVSPYAKVPLAYPQASVTPSPDYSLFTWLEPGKKAGERIMRSRFLRNQTKRFSPRLTIHSNDHVMNNPVSAGFSDSTVLIAWSQTGMTSGSLRELEAENLLHAFAESQNIWFAVFDINADSIIQIEQIGAGAHGFTNGSAQAHPSLAILSDSRALIVWQIANLNTHLSDLYYATLTREGTQWNASTPQLIAEREGMESALCLASPKQDMAVLTFLDNLPPDETTARIMTMSFQGNQWSEPSVLFEDPAWYINYLNMQFNGETGAVAFASYVKDSLASDYETLSLISWDAASGSWNSGDKITLLADSSHHIQYPGISVNADGSTAIAAKLEEFSVKTSGMRISQVDLFTGNVSNPAVPWHHFQANQFICDTTKQVADLHLTFVGADTLMLLTQEYPMSVANSRYIPVHGMTWGDPYMNQVLRCFSIVNDTIIEDVPESHYNPGIPEQNTYDPGVILFQNFPNPCSGKTTIGIELPVQHHILLELFDMKGTYIARLADKTLYAGTYLIEVNTSILEPGTYLFRLTSGNSIQTRRMVVIR